ncbi:MAG TPA: osmotically inducible protein C [Bacteroidetes bacterium]|nr:osmotically inducible protein C [Bacteroidota bacterium]HCN37691.1 osmotically inducible protein C [Bacteroidota bacterium]
METETKTKVVNGVDLRRLGETIRTVKAQPEIGIFRFKNSNQWIDGGLNRSVIKDFYGAGKDDDTRKEAFILDNDEPDILLGSDNAPNPVEYVLHALAGCITTSIVYHAAAVGYKLDKVETEIEGCLDLNGFLGINPEIRNGYQFINVKVKIEGNVTEKEKEEIIKFGPKFSPVFDTLTGRVPVDVSMM